MHGPAQFIGQNIHHAALALKPRHTLKTCRHNDNPKMRFTLGARADMASVQMRFVTDLNMRW